MWAELSEVDDVASVGGVSVLVEHTQQVHDTLPVVRPRVGGATF